MHNSREMAIVIMGAVIGGVAGYLFFTETGRRVRRRLEPAVEHLSREFLSFQDTVQQAAGNAHEGWRVMTEVLGEGGNALAAHLSDPMFASEVR